MLISYQSSLAQPIENKFKYLISKIGNNCIGFKGCKHLANSQWPQLQEISLSNILTYQACNDVKDKGALHLSNTQWPLLTMINLSKTRLIIRLEQH
jgi:hypothetical protein